MYALSIADKFVRAGEAKCALVVGAETLSRITDWKDRATAVLFADGAGAVVLKPPRAGHSLDPSARGRHLQGSALLCRGCLARLRRGRAAWPSRWSAAKCSRWPSPSSGTRWMRRSRPTGWRSPRSTGSCRIRPTSASSRRWRASSSCRWSASIVTVAGPRQHVGRLRALALDVGVRDGRIKPGQLLLLEAFGGGFTWGSSLVPLLAAPRLVAPITAQKKRRARCAAFLRALKRSNSFTSKPSAEHPVDLLVRRLAAADWLACAAARAWLAVLCAPLAAWLADWRRAGGLISGALRSRPHRSAAWPPAISDPRCPPGGASDPDSLQAQLRLPHRSHLHNDRALHTSPLLGC